MSRRLSVTEAGDVLATGLVVALPTDTVYGLAAYWEDSRAVSTIFDLKQRPSDVALPVLVASPDQILETGAAWPEEADRLAKIFWPGALTIATPAPEELARRVGARSTVGWRQPANRATLDLLARSGPLAVTSANRHGEAPARSAEEVLEIFVGTSLAGVLDGGRCGGQVSTVIELVGAEWRVRRVGGVPPELIEEILGPPLDETPAR